MQRRQQHAVFEIELKLDSVVDNRRALETKDGALYFNDKEQGHASLRAFAGETVKHDSFSPIYAFGHRDEFFCTPLMLDRSSKEISF